MSGSKPINKDWVEAYFDRGIDVANRRIFIWGSIDEETISNVVKGIYLMEGTSKEKIELFVSSEGGTLEEAFALYDVIQTVTVPISTFAVGKCMSAAPLLVACGDKGHRWAGPNCSFMIHQPWLDFGERRIDSARKELVASEATRRQWAELMEKHTSKKAKFWLDMAGKIGDQYFDAYKAQEYGIVDELWVERGE